MLRQRSVSRQDPEAGMFSASTGSGARAWRHQRCEMVSSNMSGSRNMSSWAMPPNTSTLSAPVLRSPALDSTHTHISSMMLQPAAVLALFVCAACRFHAVS